MPFQQQHSFYRWGKFMSTCSRHRPALSHRQLTHERVHLFLLKSNDGRFWGFIPTCLRIYSDKRNKFSTFASQDCDLQNFWAPLDSREASSRRPLFSANRAAHFEDLKVCVNSFSQFLHVTHEVRRFSLLQNERFALELALWQVWRLLWVQHLAAEGGRNGNCGFTTLPNVNREF